MMLRFKKLKMFIDFRADEKCSFALLRFPRVMLSFIVILCLITVSVKNQMLPFTIKLPLKKDQTHQGKILFKRTESVEKPIYKDTFKLAQNQNQY
ncbi:putative lipase [Dirofilaria immitis]